MFASIVTTKSPAIVIESNFDVAGERIQGYQADFSGVDLVDVVHTLGYHPRCISVYIGGVLVGAKITRLNDSHFTVKLSGNQSGTIYFG